MPSALLVIYAAVGLDAVGIGLVFPILPELLADVTGGVDVTGAIGLMMALYAAMQFLFAPVLGAASDRIGRRPVLILSLAGAAFNYLVMALAPTLGLLLVGRAIAGLTSANMAVASAYVTDVSPENTRARRFGLMNAMFGAGFIVGPVIGGLLGDHGVRLPFLAAAVLNAANLLLALLVLPESRTRRDDAPSAPGFSLAELNPLAPLRWLLSMRELLPLVATVFVLSATGEAYGTCWALWGADSFGWNGTSIGLSLAAFGICQTLVQATLPGPAARWFGDRMAVVTGIACACLALVAMALAGSGWMVFAVMPLFALGGIGTPALQSLASRKVAAGQQGRFQGVLAATVSLASVLAPLGFSTAYSLLRPVWPGALWLVVVAIYATALPLVLLGTARSDAAVSSG